jgi:hypothetical protein
LEPITTGPLVAGSHILAYALQTERGIYEHGHSPETGVMFAHVIGSEDGGGALSRGNGIYAGGRGMNSVQVRRLHFHVADVGFPCAPVLGRPKGGVGIRKRAGGRDGSVADELSVDYSLRRLGKLAQALCCTHSRENGEYSQEPQNSRHTSEKACLTPSYVIDSKGRFEPPMSDYEKLCISYSPEVQRPMATS